MIDVTPCFYKIISKNFYNIYSYNSNHIHANLVQNDAQVYFEHNSEHNRSKIRALNPEIIDKHLPGA